MASATPAIWKGTGVKASFTPSNFVTTHATTVINAVTPSHGACRRKIIRHGSLSPMTTRSLQVHFASMYGAAEKKSLQAKKAPIGPTTSATRQAGSVWRKAFTCTAPK